jgi:hypothetical protein
MQANMATDTHRRSRGVEGYLSYLLGFAMLASLPMDYLEHHVYLGFPDGAITDYGGAARSLFDIRAWPTLGLGVYFLRLGWLSSAQKVTKAFAVAVVLLAVGVTITAAIDQHLYQSLNHGQGG